MSTSSINNYITKRHDRWLEYATYHASRAGMKELAGDLLQEVIIMILEKDEAFLTGLIDRKKGDLTELDFYALNLIKTNAHSPTSPFRYKEEKQKIDANADTSRLILYDEGIDIISLESELARVEDVKKAVNDIMIDGEARRVFEFRFFEGGSLDDFKSRKTKKELHIMYLKTLALVRDRLCGKENNDAQQLSLF